MEVNETVKVASKLGIALLKVPTGLVQVFKDACTFCEAHTGMGDHPPEMKGPDAMAAAPDGMQTTACEGEAVSHDGDPSSAGTGSRCQGKSSGKPIVEVWDIVRYRELLR